MKAKYYRHKNLEIFCKVISEKEMVRVENYKDEIIISFWENRHLVENVLKTYEKSDAQVFKREYDKAIKFLNERV